MEIPHRLNFETHVQEQWHSKNGRLEKKFMWVMVGDMRLGQSRSGQVSDNSVLLQTSKCHV